MIQLLTGCNIPALRLGSSGETADGSPQVKVRREWICQLQTTGFWMTSTSQIHLDGSIDRRGAVTENLGWDQHSGRKVWGWVKDVLLH